MGIGQDAIQPRWTETSSQRTSRHGILSLHTSSSSTRPSTYQRSTYRRPENLPELIIGIRGTIEPGAWARRIITDPYSNGTRRGRYKEFLSERPKRELITRVMSATTLDRRVSRKDATQFFYAALLQIVGRDTNEECLSCARGQGPFMMCVMISLDGRDFCANCVWLKSEGSCTHRK